jgi:dihydroneopterin aldolase
LPRRKPGNQLLEIRINNARFYAYHGVLDYEKKYGNEFEADIVMHCNTGELGMTDDLTKTVDYLSVYKLVEKIFGSSKYNLIETLSEAICNSILENFPLVQSVEVKIRKPNAPLGIIDSVEIINKKERS